MVFCGCFANILSAANIFNWRKSRTNLTFKMSKHRETVDIYGYFCPWRGIILKKRVTILCNEPTPKHKPLLF